MMQHHDTKVPCILPDEEELFVPTIYRNDPNPNAYAASPYEQFFSSELVLEMDHQMQFTYPNGEIVVSIKCPIEYYDFLTLNWTVWVPEKCTPGYHLFHKCSDMELLSRALPNLTIGKTTERKGSTLLTELLVSPSSPVRVMYNTRLRVLRLSFFHQPVNCEAGWIPPRRVEKLKPSSRPQYWRDSADFPQRDTYQHVWHPINEGIKVESWK